MMKFLTTRLVPSSSRGSKAARAATAAAPSHALVRTSSLTTTLTSCDDDDSDLEMNDDDDDQVSVSSSQESNSNNNERRVRFNLKDTQVYRDTTTVVVHTMTIDEDEDGDEDDDSSAALWYTRGELNALRRQALRDAYAASVSTNAPVAQAVQLFADTYQGFCQVQSATDLKRLLREQQWNGTDNDNDNNESDINLVGLDRWMVRHIYTDKSVRRKSVARQMAWVQRHVTCDLTLREIKLRDVSRQVSQPSRLYAQFVAQWAWRQQHEAEQQQQPQQFNNNNNNNIEMDCNDDVIMVVDQMAAAALSS